ncbi:hypothetical protein QEN19_003233 [Hanseniaspora menglaensis]
MSYLNSHKRKFSFSKNSTRADENYLGSEMKENDERLTDKFSESNILVNEINKKLNVYSHLEQEHLKRRRSSTIAPSYDQSFEEPTVTSTATDSGNIDQSKFIEDYYSSDFPQPSIFHYYKSKFMRLYFECCLSVLSYTPRPIKKLLLIFYLTIIFFLNLRTKGKQNYKDLIEELPNLKTHDAYLRWAFKVDHLTGADIWRESFISNTYDYETVLGLYMILSNYDLSAESNVKKVKDILITDGPFMSRNFARIDETKLYSKSLLGTKKLIEVLLKKCNYILDFLNADVKNTDINYFQTCNLALGHTALILNGGSLFGLYHLGVFKALLNNKSLPRIISGSSMGACIAAIICCLPIEEVNKILNTDGYLMNKLIKEEQNLLKECGYGQQDLKFLDDGTDQELNMTKMISNVIFKGYSKDIFLIYKYIKLRVSKKMTFQEAFDLTGYNFNIVIYPKQHIITCPTLLNCITSPNVIISSAIDCSLGSEMVPNCKLLCKNFEGEIVDFLQVETNIEYLPPHRHSESHSDNNYSKVFAGEKKTAYEKLTELYNVNNFIISLARPYLSSLLVDDLKNDIKVSSYYQYKKGYQFYKDSDDETENEEEDPYENFDISTYSRYQKPFISTKAFYHLERKFKQLLALEFKHRIEVLDDFGFLNQWIKKLTIDERNPKTYCSCMTIVPSISDISILRIIEGRLDNVNYWMSVGERSTWHYIPLIKTRCEIEFKLDSIIKQRKLLADNKTIKSKTLPNLTAFSDNSINSRRLTVRNSNLL